ncbi:MAG: MmgE/PrpD family protein, partial [Actinophytocola sp.]|uniref:MmgE/PrpD family protein n=1 Tax=Actinophytocola sp. TaxID=1872138 RepID=UPI0013231C5E
MSVAHHVAEYLRATREKGLQERTVQAASRAVLDWMGATVAGAVLPPARILTDVLVPAGGDGAPDSGLVVDGRRTSARNAALINATASHTVEMDDIYRDGIYHPGSPTVAAALAVAQQLHRSGRDFLTAVALGYEVGGKLAALLQPAHYRYWHTTGTVGTVGAAAAVATLLELDEERTAHALATATTMASGLQQAFRSDSMSKPLHAGHAAEAGTLAALAAGQGFTGALDVLEGAAGLA